MNTPDAGSDFARPLSYDELLVLVRRGHIERSKFLVSSLRHGADAVGRWVRHAVSAVTAPSHPHDLSGRPA